MSLEVAAKHLAAHGRNGDSTLVHMSPQEVAGLQALARLKGKSLSTNPHTGLPEAFDLGQELGNVTSGVAAPVLGAALWYFSDGAIDPTMAAEITGGSHYVATGGKDVTGSVTGALGAYGGANVIGNVMGPVNTQAGYDLRTANPEASAADVQANTYDKLAAGAQAAWNSPSTIAALGGYGVLGAAALPAIADLARPKAPPTASGNPQMIRPYKFAYNPQTPANMVQPAYQQGQDTSERVWFNPQYTAQEPYKAATGGIVALASGGNPVEKMSNENAIGANTGFPQAYMHNSVYATPYQTPVSQNVLTGPGDVGVDPYTGEQQMAAGGIANLGGYSDGGRLLRGPGDGVSDSIPAQIGDKQPARLADGEFVVPARIVSELGNGSTDAGARQLYKMMDRVQQARGKTTGKEKVAKNTNAAKYLPA